MARAVELAALLGRDEVDAALADGAAAGRFDEGDLPSILEHQARGAGSRSLVRPDEAFSVQPGTAAWAGFGR